MHTFDDLIHIIKRLRGKDGCPWDRVQTHETLRDSMIEEAYEAVEAIDHQDIENLQEELGDVLLQIMLHSAIAEEEGEFTVHDVVDGISEKMIRRHPHVFGTTTINSAEGVVKKWEEIKQEEKKEKTPWEGLKRIPISLPACLRAKKIQKKAEKAGYSFGSKEEQVARMDQLIHQETRTEDETGEMLFLAVSMAKIDGFEAESMLAQYNKNMIETILQEKQ